MVRQFVSDVLWPPNTDYLLIDTPPGTSDEHIAIVEELHKLVTDVQPIRPANGNGLHLDIDSRPKLSGAVVVTTPQAISVADVRKELNFCVKTQVPVIGVIENMSGYMCPCCDEITNIFSKGGGEEMAEQAHVPYLGSVPLDTKFGDLVEGVKESQNTTGTAGTIEGSTELVERYKECGLCPIFAGFATRINSAVQGT
jgi:Mrp family chromosome partitioning ATPase